ncbi:dUTP diphosphatase [Paenibacillus sp. JDR-2]|uniref:dUTP diphosphatase n=1 Tax=Paenibacillus sp. (strain JDR-2) TaxID=324057 RepID=UPI000166A640|nr:dUTP diphosphatase [Paenibacillus sp. JDR-2]ACT00268.1 dUTPase [Paenibacillus sp. JDR-2]
MSEITLEQLYEMQKALDARIIKEKGLEGQDLLPDTVLALQVELGELANEWRGFKHWSTDRAPRREKMLVEYVDCVHFFLSYALQEGIPFEELQDTVITLEGETASVFIDIITAVGLMEFDSGKFYEAWYDFSALGTLRLDFTWEQIVDAYMAKNKTNHDRQANGY